jgi:hypothetical protein
MQMSGWYDSDLSTGIRRFLRGKIFAIVTMVCLFIALFCSDIFILSQVEGNTILDCILMLVFVIFFFEFVLLALTDASYLFSFFFWMDLAGTVSMIFDISFMLGSDATEPEKLTSRGQSNIIVVRAARATKLGARAGRLSRVMKLLRFLPFVNSDNQESDVKMARVISSQLNNVLSTRVAFLTICIVVVLPVFGLFTYPEADDSMTAWTELLSDDAQELHNLLIATPRNQALVNARRTRFDTELNAFADFYRSVAYGPFDVCFGVKTGDDFRCEDHRLPIKFNSSFSEPGRKASIRHIVYDHLLSEFDLSTPKQLESVANMSLIVFIIIVMCVFGLVTSSSITVIALHPLERMLAVVRARCQQIFKYTDDLQEDDDSASEESEDYDDSDHASEFALLEKVVAKLAAIAHLSNTKDEPEYDENMTENEVMALNWMQGAVVTHVKKRNSQMPPGHHEHDDHHHDHSVNNSVLDNISSDILESLETDAFSTLDLREDMKHPVAAHIVLTADGCGSWVRSNVTEAHLFRFVATCESKYQANPFHNFAHALDVQYTAARHMHLIQADHFLPETSQFWLLIAAISHDLGHLGVNNQYLIETSHELALKYNDRSPLENMHCATLFQVVSDPQANVFTSVEKDLYKEMRKGIINAILHTDVTKHNEMMKELVMLYQMNSEAFDAADHATEEVIEVLSVHTQLTINCLLHCSDVGNPMKPWELAQRIAHLCVDEFFAQGDSEKAAGIPVQMLNDREKVNRPNSQIGFIEFVIAPMVEAVVHLFPPLGGLAENLGANVEHWYDVWLEQVHPAPEVAAKTEARVKKVHAKCHDVVHRGQGPAVQVHE